MTLQRAPDRSPRLGRPELSPPVPVPGGDQAPVGGERHRPPPVGGGKPRDEPAAARVPDLGGALAARRGEQLAAGAECDRKRRHRRLHTSRRASANVPDAGPSHPCTLVFALFGPAVLADGEQVGVGREGDRLRSGLQPAWPPPGRPQGACVPERHLPALARDPDEASIGAEIHRGGKPSQRPQAAPTAEGLSIYEVDCAIAVRPSQRAAVRADREFHRIPIPVVGSERAARVEGALEPSIAGEVPHDCAGVAPRAVERATVGGDGQVDVALAMAGEGLAQLATLDVPSDHAAVDARADHSSPVGCPAHGVDGRVVTAAEAPDLSRAQVEQT